MNGVIAIALFHQVLGSVLQRDVLGSDQAQMPDQRNVAGNQPFMNMALSRQETLPESGSKISDLS